MNVRCDFVASFLMSGKVYEAVACNTLSFIPFEGMYLGPAMSLEVERVHWMGDSYFRVVLARLNTEGFQSFPEVTAVLEKGGKSLGLIWSINEKSKKVPAGIPEHVPPAVEAEHAE